ncbi:hypothetical protein L6164_024414 [Bauhinia variegata]|uniref:Uncharacterized protein n=1 Tax=Bauhinia variegata TaxID=167791 RepID=A0ACB9LXK6_BAUVA|nr:hypothetical protein L6164_024414 [Bauhinia variegata]
MRVPKRATATSPPGKGPGTATASFGFKKLQLLTLELKRFLRSNIKRLLDFVNLNSSSLSVFCGGWLWFNAERLPQVVLIWLLLSCGRSLRAVEFGLDEIAYIMA